MFHTSYYQCFFNYFTSVLKSIFTPFYAFNTKLVRFLSLNFLNDERCKINRLSLFNSNEYEIKIKINFKSKFSDEELLQIHYENNHILPSHCEYYINSFNLTLEWIFKINGFILNKLEDNDEYWIRFEDHKTFGYSKNEFEYLEEEIPKKVIMKISYVDLDFEININFESDINDDNILDYLTAKKVDKENLVIERNSIPKIC